MAEQLEFWSFGTQFLLFADDVAILAFLDHDPQLLLKQLAM